MYMKETQYIYNLISEKKNQKHHQSCMGHLSSITYKTETPKGEGKEDRTLNVFLGQGDPGWG